MITNSSKVLRALLMAMTEGDLPTVEVEWRPEYNSPLQDDRPAMLMLKQANSGQVVLFWHDGLERLAEVLGAAASPAMAQRSYRATIVRAGKTLRATAIRS